jgi:hypothetical protein
MIMKNTTAGHYRSSASLRVQGSGINFEEVSRTIGVDPSRLIEKGSLSRIGKKHEVNTWILDSRLGEVYGLEPHIRWFAQELPSSEYVMSLRHLRGVEDIDIFCAISVDAAKCNICLPPDVLVICRAMTCDLELSFVFGDSGIGNGIDVKPAAANLDSPVDEFTEQSSAGIKARLLSDVRTTLLDAVRLASNGESIMHDVSRGKIEIEFDMVLQTAMMEGKSPDGQLKELGETFRGYAQRLNRLADPKSFEIDCRFETNCEWPSTRITWQAFDLPVLLNCPLILEVALI